MSQEIYCGTTDFSSINRSDSHIIIYGDSSNSTITKSLMINIQSSLNAVSIIELKNITKVEDYALEQFGVSKFELVLPDTLEYIGKYAFQQCGAMNSIVIPASVTYIGIGAFYGCGSLNHIYFREGSELTTIPEYFCSGGGLNTVGIAYDDGTYTDSDTIEFPDSITTISNNAFLNCSSFGHTLILGNNITTIGDYAFYHTVVTDITIGSGINTGDNQQSEVIDTSTETDREINVPYTIYLSSKRQFRYKHFDVDKDYAVGYIYLLNVDEYIENDKIGNTYTYKTSDDDFKFCIDKTHLLVFKNGLLLPNTYYYLHSAVDTPVDDVGVIFNVPLSSGDTIDIFYITNDLKHLEVDYYDIANKERYIKNGDIKIANNGSTEYRNMGDQLYPDKQWRTNYIKMRSPLYAISSKHSLFVFLNGKKVRLDELEDISDTIISINTDYARSTDSRDNTMNAVRLEVMNHLDTQDIIEQLYINDALSHDESENYDNIKDQFKQNSSSEDPDVYKSTRLIKSIDLTELESYAERTLLDEILNDLSDTNLNKLFYEYTTGVGPMTKLDISSENDSDYISKDKIMTYLLNEYYNDTNAQAAKAASLEEIDYSNGTINVEDSDGNS